MQPTEQPTLKDKRVELTPLKASNIYQHFEWNNDPELNRLDSELPFEEETFGDFKRRFEQMVYRPQSHSHYFEIHANGTLIGVAYVVSLSEHNRHCTIGITIGDRGYWGEGYGRAALERLLAYCFEELGMHRVDTETFEYNAAWERLIESVGFVREGTLRDYLYRDGRYWGKAVYAILEDEYQAQA